MGDKKIQAGCFRKLKEGEGRLLIMRHLDHKDNIVPELSLMEALLTGRKLKKSGVAISKCISSPSPRAIRTGLAVLEGYGSMLYIETDSRLSDSTYAHANDMPLIKAHMKELGREFNDRTLADTIYDARDEYFWLGQEFAEGARAGFLEAITESKTTLVTTHGVGRVEPGLMLLRGEKLDVLKRLVETGQIVEVILANGEIVEENWLEPVTIG